MYSVWGKASLCEAFFRSREQVIVNYFVAFFLFPQDREHLPRLARDRVAAFFGSKKGTAEGSKLHTLKMA
jgi:hypothetical protein